MGQCGNTTFVASNNQTLLLQCVFDRQMDCPDQASCEAATNGACDDGFLEDPTMPPWVPATPACIVPFTQGDSYGYPDMTDCSNDAYQNGMAFLDPTIGCIYWPQRLSKNITINGTSLLFGNTSQQQDTICKLAGGYWAHRALSQDTCESSNRSSVCLVDGSYAVPISQAACSNDHICAQQDYSWTTLRAWSYGSWASGGSTIPTAWVKRAWAPIGKWTATFDLNKLGRLIAEAVGNRIQEAFVSYAKCSLGLYGPVFEKLAAALRPLPPSAASGSAGRRDLLGSNTTNLSVMLDMVQSTELSVLTAAVDIQPSFDAIIVGAGVAGMTAARILADQGYNILVLESRNRTGGRLWSDASLGFPVDLGASWMWAATGNPLRDLAQQCGLPITLADEASIIRFKANGVKYSSAEAAASSSADDSLVQAMLLAASNSPIDRSTADFANTVNATLFSSDTEQWLINSDFEVQYGAAAEYLSMKSFINNSDFQSMNDNYVFPNGFDRIVGPNCLGGNITF